MLRLYLKKDYKRKKGQIHKGWFYRTKKTKSINPWLIGERPFDITGECASPETALENKGSEINLW
jgi:hypothetical protein